MRYSDHGKSDSPVSRASRFSWTGHAGLVVLAAALALGLAVSCKLPSAGGGPTALTISIAPSSRLLKTLVPNIDMNAASYAISGSGPNGATFSTTLTTGSSTTITTVTAGTWTVNASGINAAGTFITFGTASAQVSTGSTTSLSITVSPIVGPGSLSLTLSWPSASVASPVITAQLIPSTGSATTLAFSAPASGTASYSGSGIMNGYYTLTLQLYDGTTLVMGAVDVVEIVQGQTTSGTYTFTTVNSKGSLQVNITPNLLNPLAVTLTGTPATAVAPGSAVTLSGSVPSGTGNVTYAWYVNGVSQALGSSFTVNSSTSPLSVGTYRVDVTAFTANGLQAGSATATISVATLDPVQLSWNANTETNLAGYKLYMGTASGVYGAPTSLGVVTTTTLKTLVPGTTYYFALTAFNTAGQESAKTSELSYKAP
jgi:Fibronectin type III domain